MASKSTKKDQEMAARLKAENDRRRVGRCPICNEVVAIERLQNHIQFHPA